MDPEDIKLESVNWEHGMLLTPDHFVRQERYFDSALLWMLRYSAPSFGVVGGGPRLPESERGAVKHDPIVIVDEDEEQLSVAVTQCRGLTQGGVIVDIDPEHPVRRSFPKPELEGVSEAVIYVLTDPQVKRAVDGVKDEANPQMKSARRSAFGVALSLHADDAAYGLPVAKIRKAKTANIYEKDTSYIPPCTSMVSHSELAAGWRKLVEESESLLTRYSTLYRAMQEYVGLFRERGIETELDTETMQFVGRMTTSLQSTLYDMVDPLQPTEDFFSALRRFFHSAAVYLDLSIPVKQYYDQLIETGESEFIALVEQQKKLLGVSRRWTIHDDLGFEIREAQGRLRALDRLELALEGKYVDFRISPTLEAMNFIFDSGGKQLYKVAAKHSRMQGFEDDLTIHFANLRLEGRDKYRLILAGEDNAVFQPGEKITAEIHINEGAGFRREPEIITAECRSQQQRNFEFDFEAPDVPTITDLRVAIPAHHPIRSGVLFKRHRFFAGSQQSPGRVSSPPPPPSAPPPSAPPTVPQEGYGRSRRESRVAPSRLTEAQPTEPRFRRVSSDPEPPRGTPAPGPAAPWEEPGGAAPESPRRDDAEPPRRRRRLLD